MTVREIYRLRHQKAVGFNRARSRVIEQLVAQRGECTDTAIFAALRDELAEGVFLHPKARIYDCCEGIGWFVSKSLDSPQEVKAQQNVLRKAGIENDI